MSQSYTPVAVTHGSYTLPSDGDPAVAESVNDALRDLADEALYAVTTATSAYTLASQAINGTTGGSYAPAAPIEITSEGISLVNAFLTISGSSGLVVSGSFSVSTSGWNFSSPGSVTGAVTFTSTADFQQLTAIEAGIRNLSISGNTSIGNSVADELTVEATSTFQSPVIFESTETHGGIVTFNNNVNVSDDATLGSGSGSAIQVLGQLFLHSRLRYSDTGRVPYREVVELPSSGSATVSVADGDVFFIPSGSGGAASFSISGSGATSGDRVRFTTGKSNALARAVSMSSAVGSTQTVTLGVGTMGWAEFIYITGGAVFPDGWWVAGTGSF